MCVCVYVCAYIYMCKYPCIYIYISKHYLLVKHNKIKCYFTFIYFFPLHRYEFLIYAIFLLPEEFPLTFLQGRCISDKFFYSLFILDRLSTSFSLEGWLNWFGIYIRQLFSFNTLNMWLYFLLACMVSREKTVLFLSFSLFS
jgi:hypothetical protein